MQDMTASIVRPVKELKGFTKVTLNSGEKAVVTLTLPKDKMGFYDDDMNYCLEDGKFNIFVGGNSRECLKTEVFVEFRD